MLRVLGCVNIVLFNTFIILCHIVGLLVGLNGVGGDCGLLVPFCRATAFSVLVSLIVFILFLLVACVYVLVTG